MGAVGRHKTRLKVKPTRFAEKLDVGRRKTRAGKHDSKLFVLGNRKDKII